MNHQLMDLSNSNVKIAAPKKLINRQEIRNKTGTFSLDVSRCPASMSCNFREKVNCSFVVCFLKTARKVRALAIRSNISNIFK